MVAILGILLVTGPMSSMAAGALDLQSKPWALRWTPNLDPNTCQLHTVWGLPKIKGPF